MRRSPASCAQPTRKPRSRSGCRPTAICCRCSARAKRAAGPSSAPRPQAWPACLPPGSIGKAHAGQPRPGGLTAGLTPRRASTAGLRGRGVHAWIELKRVGASRQHAAGAGARLSCRGRPPTVGARRGSDRHDRRRPSAGPRLADRGGGPTIGYAVLGLGFGIEYGGADAFVDDSTSCRRRAAVGSAARCWRCWRPRREGSGWLLCSSWLTPTTCRPGGYTTAPVSQRRTGC